MTDGIRKVAAIRGIAWQLYKRQVHNAYAEFRECLLAKGYKLWGTIHDEDKRRLLNFKNFVETQHLPYLESIGVVLSYWVDRQTPRHRGGLPVSIATLTGSISREVILSYMWREYSDGENVYLAKQLQREAMLQLAPKHNERDIASYVENVTRDREARDTAIEKLKKHLRNFRGNPWR